MIITAYVNGPNFRECNKPKQRNASQAKCHFANKDVNNVGQKGAKIKGIEKCL